MGFTRTPHLITWPDGHELQGLEVTMRRMSIGELADAQAVIDRLGGDGTSVEQQLRDIAEKVTEGLISWNLLDDDEQAVPTDIDAVQGRDMGLLLAILGAWIEEASGVPLGRSVRSERGAPSRSTPEPPDDLATVLAEFAHEPLPTPA